MAKSVDVVILGASFRGLWLAQELVKLGWRVTWLQIHAPQTNIREGGFHFDDWPWQVGTWRPQSKLFKDVKEFIDEVFKPSLQEISVQILTKDGPLELSGGETKYALKKFFPKSHRDLDTYLKAIRASQKPDTPKGRQLLAAYSKKIFKRPLIERWILEWLANVRNSRAVTTADWVLRWDGQILDPANSFLLLDDSFETVTERALKWAEKRGVDVRRQAVVGDIGTEGRRATGVEIVGEGFLEARYIVVASSYQTAAGKIPSFAKRVASPVGEGAEKWCWIRCGFFMKAGSRPSGLLEFSSFVMDPLMPLMEENMGLLKWRTVKNGENLTVWVRIPFGELKRRSYLMQLTEKIESNLKQLFPRFAHDMTAVLPFEEYFHAPEVGHDDLPVMFTEDNEFIPAKTKLKNMWLVGPGRDKGLEIFSRLASEMLVLEEFKLLRQKELKKSDRKIHPARNGRDMVGPQ